MSSNKNEVFEYLIDQLRQQVNKKDVTSFNVSVQISDLDEVKQVIHNLQQHIAGRDDEIRVLKDTLRQQVNNNQCEDLVHEVQSLKNQLRDAFERETELQKALNLLGRQVSVLTNRFPHEPEQYGCRKEDTQECEHEWRCVVVFGNRLGAPYCRKCGVDKPEECEHDFIYHGSEMAYKCIKCGTIK